jgi:aldehyde reductase
MEACKDNLKNLQIDYLNLYLIHFPIATHYTGLIFREVLLILTRVSGFSPFWKRDKVHWIRCIDVAGVGTTKSVKDVDGVLDINITISLEATWHTMEELPC